MKVHEYDGGGWGQLGRRLEPPVPAPRGAGAAFAGQEEERVRRRPRGAVNSAGRGSPAATGWSRARGCDPTVEPARRRSEALAGEVVCRGTPGRVVTGGGT